MLRIRTTKTSSKNIAVQVVFRKNHETKVVKHIGTANNDDEIEQLKKLANEYIITKSGNQTLAFDSLDTEQPKNNLVNVENLNFINTFHFFAYEFLSHIYKLNGFESINNSLLKDLSIIRIIEPSSKLKSLELLEKYFAIEYGLSTMYRNLSKIVGIKPEIEKVAVTYAQKNLNFNFNLVFYDVTTLYFETFEEEGIKKCGFSKDNKFNQPQILIALVVNTDGYPISVDIFEGNKFE